MATRDWASLGWTPDLSFALPTERQLAQSSIADAGKGAETKFAPTALNAQLLASLGYTGNGLGSSTPDEWGNSGPQWNDDARTWLANNGYTVGVAHDPGTSAGGRAEYFGLVDKDGKFVGGQDTPTMTTSDTLMDQVAMFAMLAGPFASAINTAQGLAAAGAAGSAAGGVGAAGEAAAAAGGGSAGGSLGSGLAQGTGNSLWSSVQNGALRGAVTGGVKGLIQGENPLTSALKGAVGGAVGGGISNIGSGFMSGLGTDAGSMDIIPGAFDGPTDLGSGLDMPSSYFDGLGSYTGNVDINAPWLSQVYSPENMATTNVGSWFTEPGALSFLPSATDLTGVTGGDYSNEGRAYSGPNAIDPVGNSPAYTGNTPFIDLNDSTPDWLKTIGGGLKSAIGGASSAVGGGSNLAALIGAGLGAASSGGSTTKTQEPWLAAQPYLKNLLTDADAMRAQLKAQPYTPQQTAAYGNAFAGLDQARSALPGLLNWGQGAMQAKSTTPSYQQLFGGGLLQAQQPTAQAGGAGGLLGESQQDRMKALMARGSALIG